MADTPTTQTSKKQGFDPSPNRISGDDYLAVKTERDEFIKRQLAANNEFMYQHYARLIRAADKSYERAQHAQIVLERKERREEAKKQHEALKGQQAAQRR